MRPERKRGAILLFDFLAEAAGEAMWALPGLVSWGGFVVCVGAPESFKTFGAFTLGLAFSDAVPDFLGSVPTVHMPVLYVSNEKSARMVRERLRVMTLNGRTPSEPFAVLHRQNVQFGTETWALVTKALLDLGRPALVLLDTEASLSRPGFDENSGKDTGVVLDCIRRIQAEFDATVILNVHPSKYGQGPAGAKVRGHTSLWGEADAVWEYRRPSRAEASGMLVADVKDGDRLVLPFRWDRDTFLLEPGERLVLTPASVAAIVQALWQEEPLRSEAIVQKFSPNHGRTAVLNALAGAVELGLVGRLGRGTSTRYAPSDETGVTNGPAAHDGRPGPNE
jgi:hypothetical protein